MWKAKQSLDLFLFQKRNVKKANKNVQGLNLFYVFIAESWFKVMTDWCNKKLAEKGHKKISVPKFRELNQITDYC
jgi:hypothetical protein